MKSSFGYKPAVDYVNDVLNFHPDKETFTREEFIDYMQWAFYNGVMYHDKLMRKYFYKQKLLNKYN